MQKRGAGGTPGGLGAFFIGLAMMLVGGWLFLNQLMVTSSFRTLWDGGASGFGLMALFAGIGFLFFSAKSWIGWLLVAGGAIVILISVLSNLVVYFRPTTLVATIIMIGLFFGGMGLIARSLRPYSS